MIASPNDREREVLLRNRVARLATAEMTGAPHVIPVCFVYDGRFLYIPLDRKAKNVGPFSLKRVKNIMSNPRVSLVVDGYFEDWKRLYFVMISGNAEIIRSGEDYRKSLEMLSIKYPQYVKMGLESAGLPVIQIVPEKIVSWGSL